MMKSENEIRLLYLEGERIKAQAYITYWTAVAVSAAALEYPNETKIQIALDTALTYIHEIEDLNRLIIETCEGRK